MSQPDLDPRWEWVNVQALGERDPVYIKATCNHLVIIPVTDTDGTEVAQLCTTCDAQFPPSQQP